MRSSSISFGVAFLLLGAALVGAACSDTAGAKLDGNVPVTTPDGGAGGAAGAPGADDAGTGGGAGGAGAAGGGAGGAQMPDGGSPDVSPTLAPPDPIGLAVVLTPADYSSTQIALASALGTLVKEDCIDSGTKLGPGSSLTLSGDVVLASQPQQGSDLWLVDRTNGALLVLDPATCAVKRQMSVGSDLNPHDVLLVSSSKAYVTRFGKNVVTTDPMATGDDLLIINPQTGAATGRVDLSSYAAPVSGTTTQARPDRAVLAAGKVFVTLGSQDAHFVTGEGRVLAVDPATDAVAATIALTGLESCSAMDVLPGGTTLYVACSGAFGTDQLVHSGVALIDLTSNPPSVSRVVAAQLLGALPLNFGWVTVLSPTQVFAGAFGSASAPVTPDMTYMFDPTNGNVTSIAMGEAFDLGMAVGRAGRLYLPDADSAAPRLRIFDVPAGGAAAEGAALTFNPADRLLPREVGWY
jgi:hypothetical protein